MFRCSVEDKFLLIYTLLKLKSVYLFEQGHLFLFLLLHISNRLIRGKSLLFVNDIDHCYKYVVVCVWGGGVGIVCDETHTQVEAISGAVLHQVLCSEL